MYQQMTNVAIIGAGIAGLACARQLSESGIQVRLFDKARGPGGRMSTRRVSTSLGEVAFDHGAQYFTARNGAFKIEVSRLEALGAVAQWNGELVKLDREGINTPLADEPLYVGTPGMNGVVKAMAQGLDTSWNTRVETIIQNDEGQWQLISEASQDLGTYGHIVCAVPAEQVSPLIKSIAPHMAQLSESIASLPCWAAMFVLDGPISMPFDAIRLADHPMIDFISLNNSKPGRADITAYVVQARADWSQLHMELDGDLICQKLLEGLLSLADNQPNVVFSAAHRWRYARVEVSQGAGWHFDSGLGIGMCGDWLCGPRVESAWLSGHQLGKMMTSVGIQSAAHSIKES
jgi:renalase